MSRRHDADARGKIINLLIDGLSLGHARESVVVFSVQRLDEIRTPLSDPVRD
jgi:hypothetical protein